MTRDIYIKLHTFTYVNATLYSYLSVHHDIFVTLSHRVITWKNFRRYSELSRIKIFKSFRYQKDHVSFYFTSEV